MLIELINGWLSAYFYKKDEKMKISDKGLDLIKKYEGLSLEPYLCPAGIPTIGYGNTRYNDGTKVTLDDKPITEHEATEMLQYQCNTIYGKCVNNNITSKTTQEQFDAMVSFTWNLGCGNFRTSTLLRKHNAKDYDWASNEFLRWNKSGGKVLRGLALRREEERGLYLS